MPFTRSVIALEGRLRHCRNVVTFGVRPNFDDYSPEQRAQILEAETVYCPTGFYAGLLNAMGKNTFPSCHTFACAQDKIRQTALFAMRGIPHPRTRVYYGSRQKLLIGEHFRFPFVGKIPRGSAMGRGVFLIRRPEELETYLARTRVAYLQEYLPVDRDMRIVVIGKQVVHAYWRLAPDREFRSNISLGGRVSLEAVPEDARRLALHTARSCGWDDVGIDICRCKGALYVIEANMKYGKEGFRQAGIDYIQLMETLIERHEI
jgi:ribosomal protein S6--L-glutamate ligase